MIQFSKFIELINSSNERKISLYGCDSGNKTFKREQREINAEVRSLSLKYMGDMGFINSVLKYPNLLSFLEL